MYGVEHGLEHTQDLDVPCSNLSTKPYSESLVTYVEYEHGVKARLEQGISARSTEYGFITSAPGSLKSTMASRNLVRPLALCHFLHLLHGTTVLFQIVMSWFI